jgi:hypothetical protein
MRGRRFGERGVDRLPALIRRLRRGGSRSTCRSSAASHRSSSPAIVPARSPISSHKASQHERSRTAVAGSPLGASAREAAEQDRVPRRPAPRSPSSCRRRGPGSAAATIRPVRPDGCSPSTSPRMASGRPRDEAEEVGARAVREHHDVRRLVLAPLEDRDVSGKRPPTSRRRSGSQPCVFEMEDALCVRDPREALALEMRLQDDRLDLVEDTVRQIASKRSGRTASQRVIERCAAFLDLLLGVQVEQEERAWLFDELGEVCCLDGAEALRQQLVCGSTPRGPAPSADATEPCSAGNDGFAVQRWRG